MYWLKWSYFQLLAYFYSLFVRTIMSAVLFIVMVCNLSFSPKKAENSEIAARITVRVWMCMPIGENNVCVAHCGAYLWPWSADCELYLRAYFKACAMPASSCDLAWGSLKYQNLAKRLRPITAFVRTSRKRFLCGTSSLKAVNHLRGEKHWGQFHPLYTQVINELL